MSELTEAEAQLMADPLWRIRNIYKIVTKKGEVIDFRPNRVQEIILHDLYFDNVRRELVLKSRKHGVSTLFEIIILDWCYFGANLQASIIDMTHTNASDKLTKIIRFAWENLDPEIREKLITDSSQMIEFANGSNINAGKNARGGQNQILHVSEWGPIAYKDPERSTEIKTGALPSADEGLQFIESTFMGGKGGDFYDLIKRSQETPEDQRTAKDFRFRFFGWWLDERNTLEGDIKWIDKATMAYLDRTEKLAGEKLSDGQRVWYWKTKQEQGIFMHREYPSTVEEALNAPVEGAIYGERISEIRAAGHIAKFSRDTGAPVFATWDLGWNDSMTVWLIQLVGRDVLWLWEKTARHVTMAEMFAEVDRAQIPVSGHFLPHDGANKNVVTGTSPKDALEKAGGVNVIIVPQVRSVWTGINLLRDVLARSWFNEPACTNGISALESYHTKEETTNGVTSQNPVHDWSSHSCDAARIFAEAMEQKLVNPGLARRVLTAPRTPEGDVIVDLDYIRQQNVRRQSMLAKSGSRRQ